MPGSAPPRAGNGRGAGPGPVADALAAVDLGQRGAVLHPPRMRGQHRPGVARARHVARPAHQHGHHEVHHRELRAEHVRPLVLQVIGHLLPGRLQLHPGTPLHRVDVALTGRFMRIEPRPVGRHQGVDAETHPAVVRAARRGAGGRRQARLRVQVGQVHGDGGRLGQHLAINQQRRHPAGRIDRQVTGRLLLAPLEIELVQLVLDAQFDQQPVHHQ